MKKIIFVFTLLSFNLTVAQYDFNNKTEVAVFNMISSGFVGGIGAMINNKEEQNLFKRFYKGFYKGTISGLVIYSGKEMISNYSKTNNYTYLWGSKMLVFTGVSMLENTVNNKKLFENLHFNIAFVRFDMNTNNFKIKPKIMPVSLGISLWLATKYKVDYKLSLYSGNIVFWGKRKNAYGTAIGNNILISRYSKKYPIELVMSHEMIHVYQLNFFSSLNTFYFNAEKKLFGNSKFYQTYSRCFYTDYNKISFSSVYQLTTFYVGKKNKNIFESEAYYLMDK